MAEEINLMKFKVELELHGRKFTERYVCYGLSELHDIIHQKHPKAKIVSIFGGPA